MRSDYNRSYNISFDFKSNVDYEKEYAKIKDYELPKYLKKIAEAKESAIEQFKSDFLYSLQCNINTVFSCRDELNRALKKVKFGNDEYRLEVKPNPAYIEYYNMIMDDMLMNGGNTLFSDAFTAKYQPVLESLFANIVK